MTPEDLTNAYRAYEPTLTRFVSRKLHYSPDAPDIVHEAFLRARNGISGFEGRASVETWLYRIVHNLICDFIRGRKYVLATHNETGKGDNFLNCIPDPSPGPLNKMRDEERNALLKKALRRLPHKEREAVCLHYLSGLSIPQIVEKTGDTQEAIKARLFRARGQLFKALDGKVDRPEGQKRQNAKLHSMPHKPSKSKGTPNHTQSPVAA